MKRTLILFGVLSLLPACSSAKFQCKGNYEYVSDVPLHFECKNILHINEGKWDFFTCEVNENVFSVWMEECNILPYLEKISDPVEVVSLVKQNEKSGITKINIDIDTGLVFYWDSEQFSGGIIFSPLENKVYIHALH